MTSATETTQSERGDRTEVFATETATRKHSKEGIWGEQKHNAEYNPCVVNVRIMFLEIF